MRNVGLRACWLAQWQMSFSSFIVSGDLESSLEEVTTADCLALT
jgi:hypothetical protein